MTRIRADGLLLFTAFIFGTAFVAQKYANDSMPPVMFCGVRFLVGMFAIMPFVVREARSHKGQHIKANDWLLAVVAGVCLFIGISLQQIALMTTTVTDGGFLTAIYVAMVPIAAWLVQGIRPRPIIILACAISIFGAWLLADNGAEKSLAKGDILLLLADIVWAFQIVLVSKFLAHTHRPFFLAALQFLVTGILGVSVGLLFEHATLDGIRVAIPFILYAGLISAGIGYTLQVVAQRYTPAAESALILSLEGVFAFLAGAVILGERLTLWSTVGCALILTGIVMVEIGPVWRRLRV